MKKLIVDSSIEWVDRKEVKPGDYVTCRSINNQNCICIWVAPTDCSSGRWEIWSCEMATRIAIAVNFLDFFSTANSTGAPLVGWKFYKVD